MVFEKEKRKNSIVMAAGAVLAVVGLILCFTVSLVGGVVILIIGMALIIITASISNVFYTIKMKEIIDNQKRSK